MNLHSLITRTNLLGWAKNTHCDAIQGCKVAYSASSHHRCYYEQFFDVLYCVCETCDRNYRNYKHYAPAEYRRRGTVTCLPCHEGNHPTPPRTL